MTREPVTITITLDGGEVFAVLTEGHDFASDLSKPVAKASFMEIVDSHVRAAINAANARESVPS